MVVLVGYWSVHGSTREIAKRIADRLTMMGCRVELRSPGRLGDTGSGDLSGSDPSSYDAVVLGSAVHDGSWLPGATGYLLCHIRALAARPVWLFSVATLGDQDSMRTPMMTKFLRSLRQQPSELGDFRDAVHPRDHHAFTGSVERGHYSPAGRMIFQAMGGRFGDHRDWPEVDAWADGIARELVEGETHPHRVPPNAEKN